APITLETQHRMATFGGVKVNSVASRAMPISSPDFPLSRRLRYGCDDMVTPAVNTATHPATQIAERAACGAISVCHWARAPSFGSATDGIGQRGTTGPFDRLVCRSCITMTRVSNSARFSLL